MDKAYKQPLGLVLHWGMGQRRQRLTGELPGSICRKNFAASIMGACFKAVSPEYALDRLSGAVRAGL